MKYIDAEQIERLPGRRIAPGERFNFRCHAQLACFNRCCRNLNLYLYPYDVLRLRKNLGIRSDEFIDRHADAVLRPGHYFPEVLLRMADNAERTCPFLIDSGCSVYADRPDACRMFPLEQGALYNAADGGTTMLTFMRPPDFCLGGHEASTWTVDTWIQDQQALCHQRMTERWAAVRRLFVNDPWGAEGPAGPRGRMAFMAAYNIDRFREFVFESSFLKRYRIKSEEVRKMRTDDAALLAFGFEWIKSVVWGIRSARYRL